MGDGDNSSTPPKRDRLRGLRPPWQPGQSGNPKGRAKGSRNDLCEAFLADMQADWEQHGPAVIARVREEKPDVYLRVVASLLPKDLNVRVDPFEGMTDEQLFERIRQLDEVLRPFLYGEDDPFKRGTEH